MHYPQFFTATRAWKHLGIWPGDTVRYDPTSSPEIVVIRRLPPNHGALLMAIEEGAVIPISGHVGELENSPIAPAPGPPLPQPGTARPARASRLRVVK